MGNMEHTANRTTPIWLPEILAHEIDCAERKAIDSLSRYKFQMFGYWAGIWVHLNKIEGKKRPNPFRGLVALAKEERNDGKFGKYG